MKIAVLSGYLDNYAVLGQHTVDQNKGDFCKRHGYDLHLCRAVTAKYADPQSHASGFSWCRLEQMLRLVECGSYAWVWCVGCDTLITNMTLRLEELTEATHRHVLICGERVAPLQADSFLVRNSAEGRQWLMDILAAYPRYRHDPWVENQTMIDLFPKHHRIIQLVPQWRLNAYDYRRFYYLHPQYRDHVDCYGHRGQWQEGDFLIHWPASTLAERLEFLKQYTPKIIG